jgi:hypothetical protein
MESSTINESLSDKIILWWMEDVLENKIANSVYLFCKSHQIEEINFYEHFSSLDQISSHTWVTLFQNSTSLLLNQNDSFIQYDDKTKLIAFYLTFFENLSMNRSFFLSILPKDYSEFQKLKSLKALKSTFKEFISVYIPGLARKTDIENINKITQPLVEEGLWMQFLFLLHFWVHDSSRKFEKTDILIEKTVSTSFEVMNSLPIKSVLDFGKFLWKERMR